MTGACRIVAQVSNPEFLGINSRVLPDADEAARMGKQEVRDGAIGQFCLIPRIERIIPDRTGGKGVGAGVLGPAERQPKRGQIGARVVIMRGYDLTEYHLPHVLTR